jgi:di/tricarboxylate transporter
MAVTIAMFMWGRWRHDMVAMAALLASVAAGLIPADGAFSGFSHPAVITVACVLILSSALQATGAVDALTGAVLPRKASTFATVATLTTLAAFLSAFMNNVAALAILMPIALQAAARRNVSPGKVLMPIAFGSILGGMTTLVGTPPNLIVSGFREAATGKGFSMFEFSPVGIPVALAGVALVVVMARWLVPDRQAPADLSFEIDAYLTEARVPEKSSAAGMLLHDIEAAMREAEVQVVGLVRDDVRIAAPSPYRQILAGDILVLEADPEKLDAALAAVGLKLEADVAAGPDRTPGAARRAIQSGDIELQEFMVRPEARLVGRSASDLRLRQRYGLNLLGVSRQSRRSMARLRNLPIEQGDILLMQGTRTALADFASVFGCIPLAERDLRVTVKRKAILASAIMFLSVAVAASGLVPPALAFAGGVLAVMAAKVIPLRNVYDAIDWPVIVLLAAMIPVAGAFAMTGSAALLAHAMVVGPASGNAVLALGLILVATMTLSDFMNNAATSAVIALSG